MTNSTTDVRIHPTATVHPSARLGAGCEIGPYAVVEADAVLGERCLLGAGAVIKRYTEMGDDNRIHEHAVLGGEPQDLKFKGHRSFLRLGHRNVVREHVTLHRATGAEGETRLGSDNFLMAQCHVGHECRIGDHVIMANGVLLAGHVQVADRAFVPGGTAVHQFCRIGRNSLAGGVTAIRQDVLPFTLATGSPARTIGLNSIGLRRAGFSADEIRLLRRALRALFAAGPKEERLRELEAFANPLAAELAAFVRSSKRGVCPLRRRVRGAAAPEPVDD
jgi:UDP-N-acetylglucosamine acyltransferase